MLNIVARKTLVVIAMVSMTNACAFAAEVSPSRHEQQIPQGNPTQFEQQNQSNVDQQNAVNTPQPVIPTPSMPDNLPVENPTITSPLTPGRVDLQDGNGNRATVMVQNYRTGTVFTIVSYDKATNTQTIMTLDMSKPNIINKSVYTDGKLVSQTSKDYKTDKAGWTGMCNGFMAKINEVSRWPGAGAYAYVLQGINSTLNALKHLMMIKYGPYLG